MSVELVRFLGYMDGRSVFETSVGDAVTVVNRFEEDCRYDVEDGPCPIPDAWVLERYDRPVVDILTGVVHRDAQSFALARGLDEAAQKISFRTADEYDALTPWKRFLHWRPGERKKIKRRHNKRVRRQWKDAIR